MSKLFIVIAAILGVLSVLCIAFTIVIAFQNRVIVDDFGGQSTVEATNAYVGTAISSTATAKAWTATPPQSSR